MKLVVSGPRGESRTLTLSGSTTIGRGLDNDVVLEDPKVSRHHALFHAHQDGGLSLIDLGSANGTFLNGRRIVLPMRVHGNDVVRLGSTGFRLLEEGFSGTARPAAAGPDEPTLIELERRDVTVLVADIRGFTRLAEVLPAEQLSQLIGRWFRTAGDVVREHEGIVDHFIGDALLALWIAEAGEPARGVGQAVEAAIALCRASDALGHELVLQRPDLEFRVGVGISSGPAVLGNIGEDGRRDYTATGDTVNIAFRIEPLTKVFPFPILVTGEARSHVADDFAFVSLGTVDLTGRTAPVHLFGLRPAATP